MSGMSGRYVPKWLLRRTAAMVVMASVIVPAIGATAAQARRGKVVSTTSTGGTALSAPRRARWDGPAALAAAEGTVGTNRRLYHDDYYDGPTYLFPPYFYGGPASYSEYGSIGH